MKGGIHAPSGNRQQWICCRHLLRDARGRDTRRSSRCRARACLWQAGTQWAATATILAITRKSPAMDLQHASGRICCCSRPLLLQPTSRFWHRPLPMQPTQSPFGRPWLLQPLRRRFACTPRGGARYAPGRPSSPHRKAQALGWVGGWVRERLGRRPRRWVGRCGR